MVMLMKKILCTALSFLLLPFLGFSQSGVYADSPRQVLDIITKVNDYWQANNKPQVRSFWDNAAYHTGNMEAYKLTCNLQWLTYSEVWAEYNHWQGATEPDTSKWQYQKYGEDQQHVLFGDWQICFQTYIDLFLFTQGEHQTENPLMV